MADTSAKSVTDIPDRLLTVDEVARMLNFNPRTVRQKAKRGEIPFIRLGRDIRFRPDTIREILEPGKLDRESS